MVGGGRRNAVGCVSYLRLCNKDIRLTSMYRIGRWEVGG
jgi:hypothetical protein